MKLAIVGAGWAGMAAAVVAAEAGADVTVFETTRALGGRARALNVMRPDGANLTLDNGQHILIGAYRETLNLMQRVGVNLNDRLFTQPLALPYPDGSGLQTPAWAARWPAPLNAVAAIATARGWAWRDKLALVRASLAWQRAGFACADKATVADVCAVLPRRVMDELIEPLCVSALNLPARHASGQVFLTVLRDALFAPGIDTGQGRLAASALLLPRTDLGTLFPEQAAHWLQVHHGGHTRIRLGTRARSLRPQGAGWLMQCDDCEEAFDQVVWATAATPAAQAMHSASLVALTSGQREAAEAMQSWAQQTEALAFTAITTVYAWAPGARLTHPMLALRADPDPQTASAQFVFDRGQLQPSEPGAQGVLAFVVSASVGERDDLQTRVMQQARRQLRLEHLEPLQTVVEKRATFACTPGLLRPPAAIAPGLWAAGDYVQGPYPATLEGAVRSGLAAARQACPAG